MWVVECGDEGVVKMLLDRGGVNPDRRVSGLTPLMLATQHGHDGVVKMLLERQGVDPNRADDVFGRAPLSFAAQRGHEGIVKILLERNNVRTDIRDREDQTPLLLALSGGHLRVVRLLGRCNANTGIADHGSQVSCSLPANSFTPLT